ncbi:DUF5681 domain-containing protein [Sphingomonas sp. MMS24-JH45]
MPKAHRFKPGRSGNPRGRPRRARTNAEVLANRLRRARADRAERQTRLGQSVRGSSAKTLHYCLTSGKPRSSFQIAEELGNYQRG